MRLALRTLPGFVLLAALTSPVAAQRAAPGWIGIALDVPTRDGQVVQNPTIYIAEIGEGSPAQQAGLRRGDRLLSIGDLSGPDDLRGIQERLRISAGERVRIRVERDGRNIEVVLRAAERPEAERVGTIGLAFQTQDMVETMVKAMDSLRIHLIEVGRGDRERGVASASDAAGPFPNRLRIVRGDRDPGVSAPFEFFVFRSEASDSLQRAMEDLNRLADDLRRRERTRMAELTSRFSRANLAERDEELRVLRTALEEVTRESVDLRAAMSDAARASAGIEYVVPGWTSPSWSSPVPVWAEAPVPTPPADPAPAPTFRPLTPYLLGSNMVAGAQVVDMQPELAHYFNVEGGVLIVDVAPGTPAAMAGIVPGDVITRLDQVAVRSVAELRFGVSRGTEALPIQLVRAGTTLEVLLRR